MTERPCRGGRTPAARTSSSSSQPVAVGCAAGLPGWTNSGPTPLLQRCCRSESLLPSGPNWQARSLTVTNGRRIWRPEFIIQINFRSVTQAHDLAREASEVRQTSPSQSAARAVGRLASSLHPFIPSSLLPFLPPSLPPIHPPSISPFLTEVPRLPPFRQASGPFLSPSTVIRTRIWYPAGIRAGGRDARDGAQKISELPPPLRVA